METLSSESVLRSYFENLTAGRMEKAHSFALRTQDDCEHFMSSSHCATMLEGQLKLQDTLKTDPVPGIRSFSKSRAAKSSH